MTSDDDTFRIRPGRIRSTRASARPKTFIAQVLKAANRAGPLPAQSSGSANRSVSFAAGKGRSTFGRGHTAFGRSRLFNPARRVVIKARIVRQSGKAFSSAPLSAHLSYLRRDGVTRDGETASMFDRNGDRADHSAFSERCSGDRHHFRFIISLEDGGEMEDLRAFTRDLAKQMEADLGTELDWIAVDHWNTDNPHVHLLVRGVDDKGKDLVIARDYIGTGLRSRAEDLISIELGPKPEYEITNALEREIDADRWTRLDGAIRSLAEETGHVDLRPDNGITGPDDPEFRRLLIRRMQKLENMGLAMSEGSGKWTLKYDAEKTLRDLGIRGDIIKTMHRAFTEQGQDRGIGDYVIDSAATLSGETPVIGRLVEKGLHDELTGEAYAVIDATDGRAHHVRFRGVEVFEHTPDIGGIVEVRRFGDADDPRPTLALASRSDLDLQSQITAPGATWLDHRLGEADPMPLADKGFGAEVRNAMSARAKHLTEQGLARRQGQRIILQRNLLATLRERELDIVAERLAADTGLNHLNKARPGDYVSGTIRQRLDLSSGRFAMIETVDPDGDPGFRLVPWSKEVDKKIGQHITGVMRDTGGIDWSIGRSRGLGL